MGQGYHSRSPEEFRQYLDSLNKNKKKRSLTQVIIIVDILLLMWVFYMISRFLFPGMETSFKPSNKVRIDNTEVYFVKSNENTESETTFFLFASNKSNKDTSFPPEDTKLIFNIHNKTVEKECLQKKLAFSPKVLKAGVVESLSFTVHENELADSLECRRYFHREQQRGLHNLLGNKKYFLLELNIIANNRLEKAYIEEN